MTKENNKILENYDFKPDSFVLVQQDAKIHDKKFETKPTTFFKDALKRFSKNKSSVAGAFILGILILLSIFVPILSTSNIDIVSKKEAFLAPKLFESGTGFWDGTKKYSRIIYDVENETPADFYKPAVIKINVDKEPTYIDQANKYGHGGYVMFSTDKLSTTPVTLYSNSTTFTSTDNFSVTFNLKDEENVKEGVLGEYKVYLKNDENVVMLQDYSKNYGEVTLNISEALTNASLPTFDGNLVFELKGNASKLTYLLLENCIISSSNESYKEALEAISFSDATQMVLLDFDNAGYWTSTGRKNIYQSKVYYCDFVFDTYINAYDMTMSTIAASTLQQYINNGWCKYDYKIGPESFEILSDKCPIDEITSQQLNPITGKLLSVEAGSYRYKLLGYDSMPKFLFGTDNQGHDIFKKAFSGLSTSLILGVCTAAFCLVFGLCWGAISGYFGGNVDLIMERFCEILSGVPWIVIMTLAILHFGNNFLTFFMALCLTGWIGVAARTRTQFYRFKGREYVLASRTLGSSDIRLIFRHVLPNAMGTIITSSVLMIPSVVFSEATLAYLNLGLQGVHSFGVMLSENQQYISSYPNLIVFPAVIIALIMISFNLFGNGLRDAFNPQLKGSE